jgi:spore coat protein CotH/PKD repeat protein
MKIFINLFTLVCIASFGNAQNLPDNINISNDGRRLVTGDLPYTGFYDSYVINEIHLNFSDPDFWDDLVEKYEDDEKENIMCSMIINGIVYDSVGIRIKGSSSYSSANDDKKSFGISMDEYIPDQAIEGYQTLNLHNCMGDPSFMAEILYEYQIHKHTPAPKGNFAHVFINGDDWGIYANVQQLNRDFIKEWFLSADGALWRAKRPPGSTSSNGSGGDSLRSLYYLGNDTNYFCDNYYLKTSRVPDPYTKLMNMTRVMDTVSNTHIESILGDYLDIDRTLWFLAGESIFADDDGYVIEGRSDYYIYYEAETGRFVPLEFDANGCMNPDEIEQDIFLNANKPNYALLYQLLNNDELHQRYLAHFRTMVADGMDTSTLFPRIRDYYNMIDPIVQNDPVSNYTYSEFIDHQDVLEEYITERKEYIEDDSEYDSETPSIVNTEFYSDTIAWTRPMANQDVLVTTNVTSVDGINKVTLFYATGIVGKFSKMQMHDDGLHNDQAAADGIYGSVIPGFPGATWVRFYVEATSDNSSKTVSYDPPGAEHDIYTYLVLPSPAADTSVVINELMASNVTFITDSSGEYADWFELYNNSGIDKDISGFYLTDNSLNLIKWEIPDSTIIPANGYLIFWADENQNEGDNHTNFRFTSSGENLMLLNSNHELVDEVTFAQQSDDLSFARIPNGTGAFIIQAPTFSFNNNPAPHSSFSTISSMSGCTPLSVDFINNSTNASSYLWNFGDGNTSSVVNPTHLYTSPGTYSVKLTAYSGSGAHSDSIIDMVSVLPGASFDFIQDTIYSTGVSYFLSADTGFATYEWSSLENSTSIVIDSTGMYCVVVTNHSNCSDSDCVYVVINTTGVAEIENKPLIIFPNPANDYIKIISRLNKNYDLEIINSLGEIIYLNNFEKELTLQISEWPNGIYFLKSGNSSVLFTIQH